MQDTLQLLLETGARFEHFGRKPYILCTSLSKEEMVRNHKTSLPFFRVSTALEDFDLPKLYWLLIYIKIKISNDIMLVRLRFQPSLYQSLPTVKNSPLKL